MVSLVRRGHSQRSVARRFRISLHTIQRWVQRAGDLPLPQVDWSSRSKIAHQISNKTLPGVEQEVCLMRKQLETVGALGFVGAQAIHDALRERAASSALPSVRTIGRILRRRGLLDGQRRVRRAAPPPGWYLPEVAQQLAELDSFDVVEDLRMENLGLFQLFTTRALWGSLAEAWPARVASTSFILQALQAHWQCHGLPAFAQFDNDVRFQGGHNHPDVIGRVMRFCLALGVTPVFAPPLETGFQAVIENFNGLWQQKVWARFHHENLTALGVASQRFTPAYRRHLAQRRDQELPRRPFPKNWSIDWQSPPRGTLIYLRRTNEGGSVKILGHHWPVDPLWSHRLLRCHVDLNNHRIDFYRLRRREPNEQPLIKTLTYRLPQRRFDMRPRHNHPLTPIR
jgi:Homeodomain-like domain